MFAATWCEKPTLYVTGASGTYSVAILLWWRDGLRRRWVQILSAGPMLIAASCVMALTMRGL